MTDPRIPVVPGIPPQDNPATPQEVTPQETTPVDPPSAGTTLEPVTPDKTDIPSGNTVLSGEDGIACVQDFLAHIFGSEFDNFRQSWQIKKG